MRSKQSLLEWMLAECLVQPSPSTTQCKQSFPDLPQRTILGHDDTVDVEISKIDLNGMNSPRWTLAAFSVSQQPATFITLDNKPADFYYVITCCLLSTALCVICIVFVVVYRKTNVIRLSQPTFLGLLPIGGLIVSLSPLTLLGKPTVVNCAYKFVPFHIGFTFSVSCLLWKIDRAFKVYLASKQMRKSSFTNLDLYCYILGVTSVDMVLQGLALIFEKTIPQEYYTTNGQNVNSMTYKTQESVLKYNLTEVLLENFDCKTEHNSLFYLSFFEVLSSFLKIVLVMYGCVLAYRTRKFNPQFAESTALLMIVYTVSLVAGLLLLIITQTMVVLTRIQQMKIYAALSSYCMCFSLLAIFGPRAWQLLFYGDIHKDDLMQRTQKMQHPKRITTGGGGGAGGGGGEKRGLGQKTYSKFGSGGLCGAEQGKKAGDEGLTKKIGKTDSLGRDRRVSSVFNLRAVAMSTDVRDFFPQATPIPETEAAKETALTLSPHDRVAKL